MSLEEAKKMTGIYHEQQISALCGKHVLNNLLQSEYFSLDVLSQIAQKLDKDELEMLYQRPAEPYNMEATGFCNIQVLQTALSGLNIELIPFNSKDPFAQKAQAHPEGVQAYIFNMAEHWFAVRKFGPYHFRLDSMYTLPHLVPKEELKYNMEFIQHRQDSIFIVHGTLPECEADKRLSRGDFDPDLYQTIVRSLPLFCIDTSAFGLLGSPGPDGKFVLRVPKHLLEKYKKNPYAPEIMEQINAYLPPDMRGRLVLAAETGNEPVDTIRITQTVVRCRTVAILQSRENCQCQSCQSGGDLKKYDDAIADYYRAVEETLRASTAAVEKSRANLLNLERDIKEMNRIQQLLKLAEAVEAAEKQLMEDKGKFEKLYDEIQAFDRRTYASGVVNSSDLIKMNDLIKGVVRAGDVLKEDLRLLTAAREAYNEYQINQAINASLESEAATRGIEPVPMHPAPVLIPEPVEQSPPSLPNRQSSDLITAPIPLLPTETEPLSPPSTVPELTIDEVRQLRKQKFGNRNVSLISCIYSPNDS